MYYKELTSNNGYRLSQFDDHGRLLKSFYKGRNTDFRSYTILKYDKREGWFTDYLFVVKETDSKSKDYVSLEYDTWGQIIAYEDHRGNIWQESWDTPPLVFLIDKYLRKAFYKHRMICNLHGEKNLQASQLIPPTFLWNF